MYIIVWVWQYITIVSVSSKCLYAEKPNSAHTSHLVKNVMILHDVLWVWPADSTAPPNAGSGDQKICFDLHKICRTPKFHVYNQDLILRIFYFTSAGSRRSWTACAHFHLSDTVNKTFGCSHAHQICRECSNSWVLEFDTTAALRCDTAAQLRPLLAFWIKDYITHRCNLKRPRCLVGKSEVNTDTLKMEHCDQSQTSDRETLNKTGVLRDFQVSFFAMSRLVSFPWTVSKNSFFIESPFIS